MGDVTDGLTNELISVFVQIDGEDLAGTAVGYEDDGDFIGEWHHYALVADGTSFQFYVDGQPVTTTLSTSHANNRQGNYGDNFDSKVGS